MVQVFLKKWWVETDFKAPASRFHYGSKVPAVTITVFITIMEQNRQNSCQSSIKFSEKGETSIVNHLHQQPRVTWRILTTKVNVKNTFTSHIDKKKIDIFVDFRIFIHVHYIKIYRLLSALQRRNIFQQDLCIGI